MKVTLCSLAVTLAVACASTGSPATPSPTPRATEASQTITLGDIDADEPTKKIKRFGPLADYLATHLTEFGIDGGRVVIARDIEEMARFKIEGTVDFYFDSAFPTLAVQELAGSEIILRRWKGGDVEYWSTYLALRNGGINRVEDFAGKVIAFEEPQSTSGFILPAGTLVERGLKLRKVEQPDAEIGPDEIGYVFSRDEENTIELILQQSVDGAGVSNEDYDELPDELKGKIKAFDRTITVPRQLVSARPGLDRALVDKVRELLIALDQTEEGRQILEGLKKTKKFDPLPPEAEAALRDTGRLIELVAR